MANPHPTDKFKPKGEKAMAKLPLSAKVPVEIDEYVRSQPIGVAEWVRQAIIEKMERERSSNTAA